LYMMIVMSSWQRKSYRSIGFFRIEMVSLK